MHQYQAQLTQSPSLATAQLPARSNSNNGGSSSDDDDDLMFVSAAPSSNSHHPLHNAYGGVATVPTAAYTGYGAHAHYHPAQQQPAAHSQPPATTATPKANSSNTHTQPTSAKPSQTAIGRSDSPRPLSGSKQLDAILLADRQGAYDVGAPQVAAAVATTTAASAAEAAGGMVMNAVDTQLIQADEAMLMTHMEGMSLVDPSLLAMDASGQMVMLGEDGQYIQLPNDYNIADFYSAEAMSTLYSDSATLVDAATGAAAGSTTGAAAAAAAATTSHSDIDEDDGDETDEETLMRLAMMAGEKYVPRKKKSKKHRRKDTSSRTDPRMISWDEDTLQAAAAAAGTDVETLLRQHMDAWDGQSSHSADGSEGRSRPTSALNQAMLALTGGQDRYTRVESGLLHLSPEQRQQALSSASDISELVKAEIMGKLAASDLPLDTVFPADVEAAPAKKASKRTHAVKEYASSEEAFVAKLKDARKYYYEAFKESGLFSDVEIRKIFINLPELIEFHEQFVVDIKAAVEHELKIEDSLANNGWDDSDSDSEGIDLKKKVDEDLGMLFERHFPRLQQLYTKYITEYDPDIRLIILDSSHSQAEQRIKFANECEMVSARETNRAITRDAYLAEPFQRTMRYKLLTESLIKATPKDHSQYESAKKALALTVDLAENVNKQRGKTVALLAAFKLGEGKTSIDAEIASHKKAGTENGISGTIGRFFGIGKSKEREAATGKKKIVQGIKISEPKLQSHANADLEATSVPISEAAAMLAQRRVAATSTASASTLSLSSSKAGINSSVSYASGTPPASAASGSFAAASSPSASMISASIDDELGRASMNLPPVVREFLVVQHNVMQLFQQQHKWRSHVISSVAKQLDLSKSLGAIVDIDFHSPDDTNPMGRMFIDEAKMLKEWIEQLRHRAIDNRKIIEGILADSDDNVFKAVMELIVILNRVKTAIIALPKLERAHMTYLEMQARGERDTNISIKNHSKNYLSLVEVLESDIPPLIQYCVQAIDVIMAKMVELQCQVHQTLSYFTAELVVMITSLPAHIESPPARPKPDGTPADPFIAEYKWRDSREGRAFAQYGTSINLAHINTIPVRLPLSDMQMAAKRAKESVAQQAMQINRPAPDIRPTLPLHVLQKIQQIAPPGYRPAALSGQHPLILSPNMIRPAAFAGGPAPANGRPILIPIRGPGGPGFPGGFLPPNSQHMRPLVLPQGMIQQQRPMMQFVPVSHATGTPLQRPLSQQFLQPQSSVSEAPYSPVLGPSDSLSSNQQRVSGASLMSGGSHGSNSAGNGGGSTTPTTPGFGYIPEPGSAPNSRPLPPLPSQNSQHDSGYGTTDSPPVSSTTLPPPIPAEPLPPPPPLSTHPTSRPPALPPAPLSTSPRLSYQNLPGAVSNPGSTHSPQSPYTPLSAQPHLQPQLHNAHGFRPLVAANPHQSMVFAPQQQPVLPGYIPINPSFTGRPVIIARPPGPGGLQPTQFVQLPGGVQLPGNRISVYPGGQVQQPHFIRPPPPYQQPYDPSRVSFYGAAHPPHPHQQQQHLQQQHQHHQQQQQQVPPVPPPPSQPH
ncbi:hypothetical protein GQ42DRAFT_160450 [Ramicandelaber brevisporus]|nr:hypothetical protein GQ42DRAFT_160450 [Ramicandelaber brevisporus]